MATVSSATAGTQTQSDLLVAAFNQTQQPKLDAITTQQNTLQNRQNYYNTLNSKIGVLSGFYDQFKADNILSSFGAKTVTTSSSDFLTATASSTAINGINTARVNRLATNDLLLSSQEKSDTNYKFANFNGDHTFTLNGQSLTVSIDTTTDNTNQKVMQKIADAINANSDTKVTASVIKDTSSTVRLSLTSSATGTDNRIKFSEPGSTFLNKIGFTGALVQNGATRTAFTDTTAGYAQTDQSNLDASLTVNGINITRGTNTIDDLLTGVTLTLKAPQKSTDPDVTLTTSVDTKSVSDLISGYLNSYNDMVKFLNSDKNMKRSDPAVADLYSRVRDISSQQMYSPANSSDPKYLSDLGITVGSDGTLTVSDQTKLTTILNDNPQKAANIFTATGGFADKMNNTLSGLLGDTGVIQLMKDSLSKQIDNATQKYKDTQTRINNQADSLRKQYEASLKVLFQAQGQQVLLAGMDTSGYNSLLASQTTSTTGG